MKWSICILFILALAGVALGADRAPIETAENDTITHIFIQEGKNGSFVNDGSGNYTLTLTDVVPYTVFFADRPARDVGFAPMDKFLSGFTFGVNDPPNAAIILPGANETSDMVIVELTNPQYDSAAGALTYTASLLKEYSLESVWFQDQLSMVDASIPERFGNVVLVIDDCGCQHMAPQKEICPATCSVDSCWKWSSFACEPCANCCKKCDCFGGCD